jgi:methylmalonyl-CoA mutase N-terminal domain/subunit
VKARLAALQTAAAGEENLMPLILDAVRVYASVGEICNTLRCVFGEYRERIVV